MPEEGMPFLPSSDLLTFDELKRLIKIASQVGITKLRFTGGEPLLKKDLSVLIDYARSLNCFKDISLTTNGFLLASQALTLKSAGLNRINISLDTLKPDVFEKIARRGSFNQVWEGIVVAAESGLAPIKLNCVLLQGINTNEIIDFAKLTYIHNWNVRFIELMPIRWNMDEYKHAFEPWKAHPNQGLLQLQLTRGNDLNSADQNRQFFPASQCKSMIENELGDLRPTEIPTNGPARNFSLRDSIGSISFISQITNDLCANCNRLRLTPDGFLRPCLMSDGELDLKPSLRSNCSDDDLKNLFLHVIQRKPERHFLAEGQLSMSRSMSQLGG